MKSLRYAVLAAIALTCVTVMPSASAFGQLKVGTGMSCLGCGTTPPDSTEASSVIVLRAVLSFIYI